MSTWIVQRPYSYKHLATTKRIHIHKEELEETTVIMKKMKTLEWEEDKEFNARNSEH